MDRVVTMRPNVLAIVPARGGSKSIPRKNIRNLAGHPLIAYSICAGLQSELTDRVIVSTDDAEIASVATAYGAEVPFLRPASLAGDDVTDLPVFEHALTWLADNEDFRPDIVVQLRPTSPLRPPSCVDESIKALINDADADSVRAVTPSGQNPYKMWSIEDGRLSPLIKSDFTEPYNMPRQALPESFWQTGHVEAIRSRTILEKHSLTGGRILPLLLENKYAVDIDTLDQWAMAEWMLAHQSLHVVRPARRRPFPRTPKLLVLDFDGVLTDNRVFVLEDGKEAVACDRGDGMGIELLRAAGLRIAVISKETNEVVSSRCRKLRIECHHGVEGKRAVLDEVIRRHDVRLDQVLYVGNDINDLECMRHAGFAVAVADARPEVLREADLILQRAGGKGAIRELSDLILEVLGENQ
jgi:YrbI family 3-deoxy-D-manno-octulosonate 8-phosphate phosphatase